MRDLRIGEIVKFTAMDEFTGQEMELTGTVIGDHKAVRKQYPEEAGEAPEDSYLLKVDNRSGLFMITRDEVLESLETKEVKWKNQN